jgi:hypothetical protein
MPRVVVDLDPYRHEISNQVTTLLWNQDNILAWLARPPRNVVVSKITLQRRLTQWGITRRPAEPRDNDLIAAIDDIFHHTLHNDKDIAKTLNTRGFSTTPRQVKNIRLSQGWRHRNRDEDDKVAAIEATFQHVGEALDRGTVRAYGRENVQSNLRAVHGIRVTENTVRDALAVLEPDATVKRRPGAKKDRKKGEFIARGRNWIWCVDGHDKFRNYGIHIYAAIDGHARKVIWHYIGNSNRTQVCIYVRSS